MRRRRGKFITFEGVEGCGKTTHARLLYRYLSSRGHRVVLTREPGGTNIGSSIRRLLLDRKNKDMAVVCELLLYMAARAQVVKDVIRPALQRGIIVISDRFMDATRVYQGYAGGIDMRFINGIGRAVTGGLRPDITILLDINPDRGLKRVRRRHALDRMESRSLFFHRRVRSGYLRLARRENKRIKVIKAKMRIGDTQRAVREIIAECLSIG